ncbi:MAG: FtsH protease activity modulator HflK [Alphaproteobacteria bacterium]|nr:FtsH protease activity modulator HflK [Alphaproteobacteria bacterium]
MPWQNQSSGGGPWGGGGGGGGQGPWGGRGGGGTPPPDLEEMLRRSQDKIKKFMPGGGSAGKIIPLIVIVVAALWLATGFYRVQPDEQGVVLIFGKWNGQTTEQGLHWNWPSPIGQVFTPKVTRSNQVNIGSRSTADTGRRGADRDVPEESVMLTSDQNIVDLQFTVFWKINNAGDYLFNIRNPQGTVKVAAESVMREVVGQTNFDETVTVGREEIEQRVNDLLQQILDLYKAGILIEGVKLQKSDPPPEVIDAFIDVQRARQDKDRLRNEAQAYANSIVPEARGQAEQVTKAAEAYRARLLKEAEGEAKRFTSVYEAYKTAPEVTRRRMYLETLGEVLGSAQKVIVDQRDGQGSGVVPYLPLPEIQKRAKQSASEPTASSATPATQPAQQ